MRKLINILIITVSFWLIACDNNEIIEQNIDLESKTEGILSFNTYKEFTSTLNKVKQMNSEERIAWEKSQGFKSFGSICNEFYEQIDPTLFKNISEVEKFVKLNSNYVKLYKESGDTYFDVQEFDNPERFLMNSDKMFIIGNKVYKKIDETYVNTDVKNLEELKKVSELASIISNAKFELKSNFSRSNAPSSLVTKDEGWGNAKIGNETYRLKVWIETFYWSYYGPESRVAIKFRSYSRFLAIYWGMEAPVTATFTYSISNNNNENMNHTYYYSGWVQKAGYEYLAGVRPVSHDTKPFFTSYNCYAVNTVVHKDGETCNCEVRLTY